MNKGNIFRTVVLLNVAAMLFFLGVMAYLGAFARYMADDYCEVFRVTQNSPLVAVINRYMDGQSRSSDRYSNLFFVGVVEMLGSNNYEIIPAVMIILWLIGSVWSVYEIRVLVGARWPIIVDVFLGALLALLSILEAPNRFQILYWRSSMATHFAPLVLLNFLVAFLILCIRFYKGKSVPLWLCILFLFASFCVGGFSEPPVTLMIVGVGVSILFTWFVIKGETRYPALVLLSCIFVGAGTALLVMMFSPAVSRVEGFPSLLGLIQRTTQYTYFFIVDTIRTLPTPTLFSFLAPAVLFYILFQGEEHTHLIKYGYRNIFYAMLTTPFMLTLLIAAGFSTSAFGQAYPVDRARFFAYFLMVAAFMLEGMLLGIWLSRIKHPVLRSGYTVNISLLILLVFAYYPLRAGLQAVQQVSEYRTREQQWDERDAQIRLMISQGQTDLIIPQLSGVDGVKELDVYADHWVNRCAAQYYGVNSIQAITVK